MMGISEIRAANAIATDTARRENKVPFVPTALQRADWAGGNLRAFGVYIPFLADYDPPGWEWVKSYFVDAWGSTTHEGGGAMLQSELAKTLARDLPEGWGIATVEHGQFQLYLGIYKPVSGAKVIPIRTEADGKRSILQEGRHDRGWPKK